jgi:beta-lactamase class A
MKVPDEILSLSKQFSGTIGVAAGKLSSPEMFALNAGEVFPTASCIKIPILVELCRQVLEDNIDLSSRIPIQEKQQVPGTGVIKDLRPGLNLSIYDLATLSITVSDNSAANILIDILGKDSINEQINSIGMVNTCLETKFVFDAPKQNVGTPQDFYRLLNSLWEKTILDESSCNWILGLMERQQHMDIIPRYLPYDRSADDFKFTQKVLVANKAGMLSGVVNDMAIVHDQNLTCVVVVFTKGSSDPSYNADNEGVLAIAKTSKFIFDHLTQYGKT